jgi:hypothetical protein
MDNHNNNNGQYQAPWKTEIKKNRKKEKTLGKEKGEKKKH